jgi:hypothetical protein
VWGMQRGVFSLFGQSRMLSGKSAASTAIISKQSRYFSVRDFGIALRDLQVRMRSGGSQGAGVSLRLVDVRALG